MTNVQAQAGAGLDAGVPAFVMSVIQLRDGHHSLGVAVRSGVHAV